MLEFVLKSEPKGTFTRVGNIQDSVTRRLYPTPSTGPCLRTEMESKAFLRLFRDGARPSAIFVPLSRRIQMRSNLGPLISSARPTLDDFVTAQDRPVVFPDPESEVLSQPCQARERFLNERGTKIPEQVERLFQTRLRDSLGPDSRGFERVWDQTIETVGISNLGDFYQTMTRESGSKIFLAPGPMIRGSVRSVKRALQVAWRLVDDAAANFDAVGPHFLFHSDFFGQDAAEAQARAAFLDSIQREYASQSPRKLGYASIKLFQNGHDLSYGAAASQRRVNISEFIRNLSHHVRAMGGAVVAHNFGTLVLGPLQSGADIASFRGDARPYFIDPIWHRQKARGRPSRKGKRRVAKRVIAPWDAVALCDGSTRDYRTSWEKDNLHAFRTAEHVEPEAFWDLPFELQFEYRTRQIIGSLIQVGVEYYRDLNGEIPIGDAVRSRIQRMREQDAIIDYCPSLS